MAVGSGTAGVDGTLSNFQTVTAGLINAYTLDADRLSNIKVSYVNFYGHNSKSNSGLRVPMMLRVGGSVLSSEHSGADAIQVFFDDGVDASSFYEDEDDVDSPYVVATTAQQQLLKTQAFRRIGCSSAG